MTISEEEALNLLDGYDACWLAKLNDVYNERNRVIALLTKFYPSYMAIDDTSEDGFKNIVYIETPQGQLSWHITDEEVSLFKHLKYEENKWDGHTTREKYQRIERLINEG